VNKYVAKPTLYSLGHIIILNILSSSLIHSSNLEGFAVPLNFEGYNLRNLLSKLISTIGVSFTPSITKSTSCSSHLNDSTTGKLVCLFAQVWSTTKLGTNSSIKHLYIHISIYFSHKHIVLTLTSTISSAHAHNSYRLQVTCSDTTSITPRTKGDKHVTVVNVRLRTPTRHSKLLNLD